MKLLIAGLMASLLSGCMTLEEQKLADIITETRYNTDMDVFNQCAYFASNLSSLLLEEGISSELTVVSTDGLFWNHMMVQVGDYYMDNNSWFPYKRGDGLFDDLHFYKFQGEEGTDGIKYNN